MTRYDRRQRALAICLSALAGYVDATGFIASGGFFVSFMSGNSTRLGVGAGSGSGDAAIAGALILAFVVGVAAGSLTGRAAGGRRRGAVPALVAALLAAAAAASGLGALPVALAALALAMGAENAVFEEAGEVRVGLTYMTGSLVRVGQGLAGALTRAAPKGWQAYLLLWIGFIAGAVGGSLCYGLAGLACLWGAAALTLLLALASMRFREDG